jgi:hypothetical protein
VRLEVLGYLKKFNDLIENRTRDLQACSIKVHDDPFSVCEMFHAYRRTDGSSEINRRSAVRTRLKLNKEEKEITEWSADRAERHGQGENRSDCAGPMAHR